jgi:hypothetical protein
MFSLTDNSHSETGVIPQKHKILLLNTWNLKTNYLKSNSRCEILFEQPKFKLHKLVTQAQTRAEKLDKNYLFFLWNVKSTLSLTLFQILVYFPVGNPKIYLATGIYIFWVRAGFNSIF